ncbi:MAG: putative DNA binding domain-containing protein, partial [Schleiferiaceae bacterium]|nr:putative DNA binding domain-containing protein [Schleiferiaceae bacterium]
MLTSKEIKSIIASGEGYNAEFKVRVPSKLRELSEEICAFANAAGGVLILGVRDDNQIVGVELDNRNISAIQNALNEINPPVFADVYKVEADEKNLWIIEVNSGEQKPYVLSGAIFVRQGANSQKLTSVEQMRYFFQQAERIYFDEAPCVAFEVEKDIELDWFEEFRVEANLTKAVTQNQIIQNLRLLTVNRFMKNGGVLFFGKHPETFFDTALIRCVAFEGITKTQIFDDKVFTGPLVKQYEQAMQWLKGKLNVRYEIEGGGPRKEHWEIPETAFREAIVNALAHRDYYDKGAKITIELFDDRVEISNPGGLTSAIKPEEFGKRSHSRNPLIFGLFARIRLVEQIGSGIGRIQSAMIRARLPMPEFKTQGLFTVIFQRLNSL